MPAVSRASADELQSAAPPEALTRPAPAHLRVAATGARVAGKGPSRAPLWLEAAGAVLDSGVEKFVTLLRRGWIYRSSLRGPITDRIWHQPADPRPRRLDDANLYYRGRYRFAGHTIDAKDGSVFDCPLPGPRFAAALHGFEWLRHLEAAGGENAVELARKLVDEWLQRNARYSKPAWQPEIVALRLLNIFAHGRFFITGSDLLWRSKLFVSLRDQAHSLARTIEMAPDGLPRLEAAAVLALAGPCLDDARSEAAGLKRLAEEIEKQILPDGGHVSRSPEALCDAFRVLSMVQDGLQAGNRETQTELRGALDRMSPMMRFFALGDGAFAVFNGGGESDAREVAALTEKDDAQGKPFGHAPHSAYQRLACGRTRVVMDIGRPPPGKFATRAHAGCLSFEMSAGAHRMIVNCGVAPGGDENWSAALRATAAHSTLTLANSSSAAVLAPGILRSALGPRLLAGEGAVHTRRSETAQGLAVEASHELYLTRFGMMHRRQLALSPKGLVLTGSDQLRPSAVGRRGKTRTLPFAIRFHIHPDVRLSLAQGGGSVILKLPNGEGWRFRCGGGALTIEESVYLGGGTLRRCEQLVISGEVRDEEVDCAWLLEQIGAV